MADNRNKDTLEVVSGAPLTKPAVAPKEREVQEQPKLAVCLEMIAEENNLLAAFNEVKKNDGAPGIDRQSIEEVANKLKRIIAKLHQELLDGTYKPGDVKRVWIPKSAGGKRGLGIPNVIDRIAQQAVNRILMPLYDPSFHPSSHGFRPGRSCHTAIAEAKSYVEDGRNIVVDIDLEKFFDTVNHERLMSTLRRRISDKRILRLIHQMLKTRTVMPDGVKVANEEGVPQGGPLSPLLSNIVLSELDEELSRRGHQFVRYADDCNIYVRSEKAGKRVMESITRFIEKRLRLKVNQAKSAVAKPQERHFLGFTLNRDDETGEVEVKLSERTKKRIAEKIAELTPRNWGQSLKDCIKRLNSYLQGWFGFFRICTKSETKLLGNYDAHIRRRLRAIKLKQWKRKRTIVKALITLGVNTRLAWKTIYQGKRSLWKLSHTPAVDRGLRNAYFAELGLKSLLNMWQSYQDQGASRNSVNG
jgi:group II intron reverse transcriptase/maturase